MHFSLRELFSPDRISRPMSYMTITAHFINKWEMHSHVLQTRAMHKIHTSYSLLREVHPPLGMLINCCK